MGNGVREGLEEESLLGSEPSCLTNPLARPYGSTGGDFAFKVLPLANTNLRDARRLQPPYQSRKPSFFSPF